MKKVNIVTLGCSKNLVDSEKLMRQLQSGGYSVIHDAAPAEGGTVIVNTCGFINDAKDESIGTILSFVRAKEEGSIDNLYVMGCLSERYMDDLRKEVPEVSRYFGVNNLKDIVNELGVRERPDLYGERVITGPGHFAYLKISEGCDRTCSFCAIPAIRGKHLSRPVDDLIREASILADSGVKELILIAQDLTYYGIDIYKKQMLATLVKELASIDKLRWIRLHYLYPASFPGDLTAAINENSKVCRYIDIPFQHISDKMLKIMRRSHNEKETRALLTRLRGELPGAAFRSTLISGHPGETLKEHRELMDFVKESRFERLGVFRYSHEEDTYSYKNYKDSISEKEKERRVSELMQIQQEISAELNSALVGKEIDVIIDRREGAFFVGRTEFDSPEVDQEVLIPYSSKISTSEIYRVKITASGDFDLNGELVN